MMNGKKLIRDFMYKGRRCVVIEVDMTKHMKKVPKVMIESMKPYCNGYVELKPKESKRNIEAEEITYQGNLKFGDGFDLSDGKRYVGFDTAHYWNDQNPKSKTADSVIERCKMIVEELIAMGD